ncbi:M24 family metallopeptidase [Caldalkalibacillus mannanilyticus]|uniref:M24 family metallopeptidase n=1 Tax=Caldalkalibacillus mannanilyticus TaxID=1418 RepID=UPI00046AD2FB|nr:Xaa-Pro peptidase family protein [Caldalkalibacillus mannanilyticus]
MRQRIEKLKGLFDQYQIDALLVTSDSNRRYMTGFTGTAGVALITMTESVFITDFRYVEQATNQIDGYTIVKHDGPISETIAAELKRLNIARLGFEQDHVPYSAFRVYKERFTDSELVPISGAVEPLRMVKEEEELQLIRQAVRIVDETYEHILKFIKVGMREWDVAMELEFYMRKLGATSSSFSIIVASGVRSALPHGVASEKVIEQGDFVTLDFGALYQGYCSDMTRTFAMGEPCDKLKEIYDVCLQAQLIGVQQMRAGMTGKEADALCRDYISAKGYGEYFGHSTGHAIGLEVHETPGLSVKVDRKLEPGMVVTVEPGIYLPGIGGVRIEDDIVITEDGNEILTQSPKELIIIE